MGVCTFFGHRDCPDSIKASLRETLIDLIVNHNVEMFYVCNQGRFDAIVRGVLCGVTEAYPQAHYAVVLAYMPKDENADFSDTMLPEGIESVHPRYAISWRNNWRLRQSDYVVTYITHSWVSPKNYSFPVRSIPAVSIRQKNFRRLERQKTWKIAPKRYSFISDSASRTVADRREYTAPKVVTA